MNFLFREKHKKKSFMKIPFYFFWKIFCLNIHDNFQIVSKYSSQSLCSGFFFCVKFVIELMNVEVKIIRDGDVSASKENQEMFSHLSLFDLPSFPTEISQPSVQKFPSYCFPLIENLQDTQHNNKK